MCFKLSRRKVTTYAGRHCSPGQLGQLWSGGKLNSVEPTELGRIVSNFGASVGCMVAMGLEMMFTGSSLVDWDLWKLERIPLSGKNIHRVDAETGSNRAPR